MGGAGSLGTFVFGAVVGATACYYVLTHRPDLLTTRPQENTASVDLQQDQPPAATPQLPNATEVFRLQSECAIMGEKRLANSLIGPNLTQQQVSHYEPRNGHCYVELDVYDPNNMPDYYMRYLYDGQTKEMLAFSGTEKGRYQARMFGPLTLEASASEYIDRMMEDKDR